MAQICDYRAEDSSYYFPPSFVVFMTFSTKIEGKCWRRLWTFCFCFGTFTVKNKTKEDETTVKYSVDQHRVLFCFYSVELLI